jgi:hypothetical protein
VTGKDGAVTVARTGGHVAVPGTNEALPSFGLAFGLAFDLALDLAFDLGFWLWVLVRLLGFEGGGSGLFWAHCAPLGLLKALALVKLVKLAHFIKFVKPLKPVKAV